MRIAWLIAACGLWAGAGHAQVQSLAVECESLSGTQIPPQSIALPTGGARVVSAQRIQPEKGAAYCRVDGEILSQAPSPPIRFRLNLPDNWNGTALQMGGAGLNGYLVTADGPISNWPQTPLQRGYATFGSDSGHRGNSDEGEFALDEGALINFGYAHLKKTRDTAFVLIRRFYGKAPERSYFAGNSTGGREALTAIARYPDDYDGAIAIAPAVRFVPMRLFGVAIGQSQYAHPEGWLSPQDLKRVHAQVLSTCDALDGLTDGIVGNVTACRARREQIITALGLSAAKIQTLRRVADGLSLPYDLAHGVRDYPGYPVLEGADLSDQLGQSPTAKPPYNPKAHGNMFSRGEVMLRYFVARDRSFDSLSFDLARPGQLEARLREVSGIVGAMNPDTKRFQQRGGKLILMQGLTDEIVSPGDTIGYYDTQRRLYGSEAVERFIRFYTVPGFAHSHGVWVPEWDALGALDQWVRHANPPQTLETRDRSSIAGATRTRPLCLYPTWPRYNGSGPVDNAASFHCAQ